MSTETVSRATGSLPKDLLRSSAWVERPRKVELRETHISWVFLTDRFAYKVKKPVSLGFLDFSTPQRRHQACLDEVRLNRRLCGDVYLGVVPITRSTSGRLRVGGMGVPVDWAVKMYRLPDDRSLASLIEHGTIEEGELQRLVNRLACFYSSLPPLAARAEQYRADLERHVRENEAELSQSEHELSRLQVTRVHASQRRFIRLATDLIDTRVCDGRIVEGHGDLRPEHIYLTGEPVIIDCVEFSRELRSIDVLDEVSFLAMECAMLGAASIGRRILTQFCAMSGDRPDARLLALYQSYRACVRAKVMAIRASQLEGPERRDAESRAARYLSVADEFASQLGPPVLVIVSGVAGTGKSTVAEHLSQELALTHLQTDAIRRELFGPPSANDDRYSAAGREAVYREVLSRAESLLSDRQSVVLDGTFLRAAQVEDARRLAVREGARVLVLRCHCPSEVAKQRIACRSSQGDAASEATIDIHDRQLGEVEAIPGSLRQCQIDTTLAWPEIWSTLRAEFYSAWLDLQPQPAHASASPRAGKSA